LNKTQIATLEQDFASAKSSVDVCIEDLRALADIDVNISEEALKDVFISISKKYKEFTERFATLNSLAKKRYKTEYAIWAKKESKVIAAAHSLSYDAIKDIDIDYPTGMTLQYHKALDWIVEILSKFESVSNLKLVSATLDKTLNSISNDSNAHEATVSVAVNTMSGSATKLQVAHKALVKSFSISAASSKQKPFGEMFNSIEDLHQTYISAGLADNFVVKSPTVSEHANNVEDVLDLIIGLMKDKLNEGAGSYVPSKDFIKTFASFVELIDSLYIIYGDCVIRTLAIHHNLTFVYRTITKG